MAPNNLYIHHYIILHLDTQTENYDNPLPDVSLYRFISYWG